MGRTKKVWINGLFLAVTLAVNTLGATGIINGLSQKQVSDRYPTLITPSPATFGIWSVIYSLLIASVIVMIVKKGDPYYQKATDRITPLFRISCMFNMAWIVAFSYLQLEISALLILGLVITLSLICQKLLTIQERKRWLLPLSFGLYTGWLFIATVVNIAAALVKLGWNRFGIDDEAWAMITLAMAVLLIVFVQMRNRNVVFPLPVAWAYLGIYTFLKSPEGYQGQYGALQTVSLVGIAILIAATAVQFYQNRFAMLPETKKQPASTKA
ncbi:MAG TPA: tryptophan-rich sensory protein [Oscillospiraceae bacterium]|nr:tryptophan-rich sensory protein [Oscillospiraceae bacterium]HRW56610.1 tryptophan-rich sensory protein [Oscillospiraceae bacterium]